MLDKGLLRKLIDDFRDIWFKMDSKYNGMSRKYVLKEKIQNEKKIDKFLELITYNFANMPKDIEERELWSEDLKLDIKEFICSISFLDESDKEILCGDKIFETTLEFCKEAMNFDSNIKLVDIGQAMRNVWIMNLMQSIIGIDIRMSKSIFAYSMLYPYTDNLLDSKDISKEEKQGFNERLEKTILGESVEYHNDCEYKVWRLIKYIEEEYPRDEYMDVFQALLYIKKAQDKSLDQQMCSMPYEKNILDISIEKGGTSVLADGYLIKGDLTEDEIWFFFGYGVMLQICDDIQDVKNDKENEYMTMVSQIAGKYELDIIVCKLMNFINFLLDNSKCFNKNNGDSIKELIRKNCLMMVYFAMVQNKEYYDEMFIEELIPYMPCRISYMRKLNNKVMKKYKKIYKRLEKRKVDIKEVVYGIEI